MSLIKLVFRLVSLSIHCVYRGLAAIGGLVAMMLGIVQFGYGVTMHSPFHILCGACVCMAGGQAVYAYFGYGAYDDEGDDEEDEDEGGGRDGRESSEQHSGASAVGYHDGTVGVVSRGVADWSEREFSDERAA